jgi:hypothetical protein
MTSHCPDLVQIPLTHKYMTSDCPDLVPLTHKYMTSDCPDSEMSCICVLGVSVPSQDSEMSCICVLGEPSQDSQMSCICVLGVPSQDSHISLSLLGTDTPNTQIHDISLS